MTIEEVVEEKKLTVEDYALKYGMPQFLFHVTTAYNILRQSGVEIGKKRLHGFVLVLPSGQSLASKPQVAWRGLKRPVEYPR